MVAEVAHSHMLFAQLERKRGNLRAAHEYGTWARDAYKQYGFAYALRQTEQFLEELQRAQVS